MYDEFRLLQDVLPVRLLCMYAFDAHDENDNCGFEVEQCLAVFNLPPRIGRHGVHGCRAVQVYGIAVGVAIVVDRFE